MEEVGPSLAYGKAPDEGICIRDTMITNAIGEDSRFHDPRRHAELVVAVRAGHSALYLHRPIFFFQLGKLDHCQK